MMQRRQLPPPAADQPDLMEYTADDLAAIGGRVFTIQQRFERFNRAHPEVQEHLVRLCRRWRLAGRGTWSIKGAFEVLRWDRHLAGLEDEIEVYRLNNSYTARYARLLMREHPELDGLFELRDLRS